MESKMRVIQVSLKNYISGKIEMLKSQFHLTVTDDEIDHFRSLNNEIAVDNYARKLIMEKL